MTPLSTLSLTRTALNALVNHGIESVEAMGRLTHTQIHQLMPYCHAQVALAQFRQWHNQRYPSPERLMIRRRQR